MITFPVSFAKAMQSILKTVGPSVMLTISIKLFYVARPIASDSD